MAQRKQRGTYLELLQDLNGVGIHAFSFKMLAGVEVLEWQDPLLYAYIIIPIIKYNIK